MEPLGIIAPWVLGSVGIGVVVGYFLSVRGKSPEVERAERERQSTLAVLVQVLTSVEQMHGVVEVHNSEIRDAADRVGSLDVSGDMESVQQALLTHMVSLLKANQRLQSDLASTRYRMEEQAQEIDHVRREARTDTLTTVANRKAYEERIRALLADWDRRGEPFALMLCDLDHLKRINDAHGHPAGDHALQKLGRWLKEWVREGDFVGRYGGDEFAVLLPATELATALTLAEKIRSRTAERAGGVTFRGEQVSLSLSIGVAAVRDGDRIETLVERADQALLKSKRRGRNLVTGEESEPPPAVNDQLSATSSQQAAASY